MTRRTVPLARLQGLLDADRGLAGAEWRDRLARYGPNDIIEIAGTPWWDLVRDTLRDPMIWFLLVTSALYGALGERAETVTLLIATLPLIGMDAFLHRRTQASTEGLSSRLAVRATVLRDGSPCEVPATEVVPGDLALVGASEPFPADGIIIAATALQVDESALTGEAYPIRKQPLLQPPQDGPEPALDSEHWGFAGTRALTGQAKLRVVFTGGETLYGEIVRSATSGAHARTPLQSAIASLVSVLIVAASVICLILAYVRLRDGYGWVDALVSALTLAVAALPEEFPVVFTFFLGVGVYRLAKRQALVRRAVSVENIGRVSYICSDKTGTITEGRLHLTHLVPAGELSEEQALSLAAIASRRDSNDPLDTAIWREVERRGLRNHRPEVIETFPFTEDTRRETAIVREHDGAGGSEERVIAVTKGSPEVILPMAQLDGPEHKACTERVAALAAEGHKIIACAWRRLDRSSWTGAEPEHGYRLAGLLAFEDPVREGVAHAIDACREAGIHTIMVTGDHPITALVVAREIGLGDGAPVVISAEEMEQRLIGGEGRSLREVDVIARAVPSQKLALVRALQESGEIVAVTGDGVNDVPALQAADIGIAMGERGTRSAREVAAIVLLDDNFRTIVGAIGEGRQLFRNLQLSFQYLLMIHIPLVITAALIPLAGYPVLYLPIHIVWYEMIVHPTMLLVFQNLPLTEKLARSRPRRSASFFRRRDWLLIAVVGALITLLVVAGYVRSLGAGRNVEHARAMALAALTVSSGMLTAYLSRLRTGMSRLIAGCTIASSLLLIQVPPLAKLLHLQPLHWDDWATAVAGSVAAVMAPLLLNSLVSSGRSSS